MSRWRRCLLLMALFGSPPAIAAAEAAVEAPAKAAPPVPAVGAWVEWQITVAPPPESKASEAFRCRMTVIAAKDGAIEVAVDLPQSRAQVTLSSADGTKALATAPAAPPGDPGAIKLGAEVMQVEGNALKVRTERWEYRQGQERIKVERWSSVEPFLPLEPALVRVGAFQMVVIGFGQGQAPAFPLGGAPGEKQKKDEPEGGKKAEKAPPAATAKSAEPATPRKPESKTGAHDRHP